jgi:hypothetical protein
MPGRPRPALRAVLVLNNPSATHLASPYIEIRFSDPCGTANKNWCSITGSHLGSSSSSSSPAVDSDASTASPDDGLQWNRVAVSRKEPRRLQRSSPIVSAAKPSTPMAPATPPMTSPSQEACVDPDDDPLSAESPRQFTCSFGLCSHDQRTYLNARDIFSHHKREAHKGLKVSASHPQLAEMPRHNRLSPIANSPSYSGD